MQFMLWLFISKWVFPDPCFYDNGLVCHYINSSFLKSFLKNLFLMTFVFSILRLAGHYSCDKQKQVVAWRAEGIRSPLKSEAEGIRSPLKSIYFFCKVNLLCPFNIRLTQLEMDLILTLLHFHVINPF